MKEDKKPDNVVFNNEIQKYDAALKPYAKFNFEPIIGEVYHLYKRENGETFLSIIAPEECNFHALGSFYLNADQIWEKI